MRAIIDCLFSRIIQRLTSSLFVPIELQLIELFQKIFNKEQLDINLRPYQIISTGHSSGLVEFVEGALSIDSIKKQMPPTGDEALSLTSYFKYGLNLGEVRRMVSPFCNFSFYCYS